MKGNFKLIFLALLVTMTMLTSFTSCESAAETAKDIKSAAEGVAKDVEGAIGDLPKIDKGQHSEQTQVQQKGPSITDYFKGKAPNAYRRINSSTIFPQSGDCPEELGITKYLQNEDCFFCETAEILDNKIIAYSSPLNSVNSIGKCTEKSSFSYPSELDIVDKKADRIVAKGTGNGHFEQVGDGCGDGTYTYRYETQETWIFTTENLEKDSILRVETGAPGNIINAPGWNNPETNMIYSEHGLTVSCESPEGFHVNTYVKVIKINGYEATGSLQFNQEKINDSSARYTFASFWDAEYTVVGVCRTWGKNGGLIDEKYSETEFIVKVTGSPQGEIPEHLYKK